MIQRIQSVYLFLVAIATSLIYIFPFGEYVINQERYRFDILGLTNLSTHERLFTVMPVLFLVTITMIMSLITIFLYKNRLLQLKLGRLNIFLYLILIGTIFYYSDRAVETLGNEGVVIFYQLGAMLPIICIILTFLANRAIRKDEALVRSADRIR
jgi:hypothetical protein